MQGDFITKIKAAYNQFTKTEKKVADFVLENPQAGAVHVHYGPGGQLRRGGHKRVPVLQDAGAERVPGV